MSSNTRIHNPGLQRKVCSAEEAARLIQHGDTVGTSGFTGSGYPKIVSLALAEYIEQNHAEGKEFKIKLLTGASTGPELDGALAKANGVSYRAPYNSDPIMRERINKGDTNYFDCHLSHTPGLFRNGALGDLDVAIIEITAIKEDGQLIPATSLGNNQLWLDRAKKVILEVNSWQSPELEGIHDVWEDRSTFFPKQIINIHKPGDRIGSRYLTVDPEKVIAVVETHAPDRNAPFSPVNDSSKRIAGHLVEFFKHQIKLGRMPENLLPLQSGVGNVANAVMDALDEGSFENLTAYTEVIQDGMLSMLESGKMSVASATAFSLSPEKAMYLNTNAQKFKNKVVLRPQEISNHPGVVRRLGCIAMNGAIEIDIFGNVNSTHVMGTRMMNGIGGSGDFTRNSFISIFMTPSLAKNGAISAIVPMVPKVDHIAQDVQAVVTEQGFADLRGLSPKQRAQVIIENCAHPSYKPLLKEYYKMALEKSAALQTPHFLQEALSWHQNFISKGTMQR